MSQVEDIAGRLLREARMSAGLTQVELAVRAGVAQSVISAYESGRRQPSLPTLATLVAASGMDLTYVVEPRVRLPASFSGPVGRIVAAKRHELVRTAAGHGATSVRVFGSVARGDDRPDSDVDLLVDLPESAGLLAIGRLVDDLEGVLDGVRVDVVPAAGLKVGLRDRVMAEAVPL
jgi:uncharacterized protein